MLTLAEISQAVKTIAPIYDVTKMTLFGSYASGEATEKSDLDFLVEFKTRSVPLFTLFGLKYDLEDTLGLPVDVVHAPIRQDSLLSIKEAIPIYEQA